MMLRASSHDHIDSKTFHAILLQRHERHHRQENAKSTGLDMLLALMMADGHREPLVGTSGKEATSWMTSQLMACSTKDEGGRDWRQMIQDRKS